MNDPISQGRVALLHPKFRQAAEDFINDIEAATGLTFRIVQGLRTFAEQDAIYAEGRTVKGPNVRPGHPLGDTVTKSPAGASYHNYGLAIDIVPLIGGKPEWKYDFLSLKPHADKYGITMGYFFPARDADHFENKYGHNWRDLLDLHEKKNFIPGTTFVNI